MIGKTNPLVDPYFIDGCGRCPLWKTPQCKVHNWDEELKLLRAVVLDCGLTEELKWSMPCYTFQNSNIVLLSAFNDYCALSFFKGALLKDAHGILVKPGENTQSARNIQFTHVDKIAEMEPIIRAYIQEATEVEKAGLEVDLKETKDFDMPDEFQDKLDQNADLKAAFEALTPGRQRGYLLYFSGAKQSKTRASRVEKYILKILGGKGFHDR